MPSALFVGISYVSPGFRENFVDSFGILITGPVLAGSAWMLEVAYIYSKGGDFS